MKLQDFKKRTILIAVLVILAAGLIWAFLYNSKQKKPIHISDEYSEFVSAVTSGIVSSETPIKVLLVNSYTGDSVSREKVLDGLFSFSPTIKGHARWNDDRTLEFIPSERLKKGTLYEVTFQLGNVANVPSKLKVLKFTFQTITQDFTETHEQLHTYGSNPDYYYLEGNFTTADVENNQLIEKIITAITNGKENNVKWNHHPDKLTHSYVIDSIKRTDIAQKLEITFNGEPLGLNKSENAIIDIPAISDFKVLDAILHNDSSQYFAVYFSDPLNLNQDIIGLAILDDVKIKFTKDGNVLKIYPFQPLVGESHELTILESLENFKDKKLGIRFNRTYGFSDIKPAVQLVGHGVIIPKTDSIIIPFKAVNLKAIDVTVTKIYKNNIGQFLQNNDLQGNYELTNVARPIIRQRINLQNSGVANLSRWHLFSLDLAKLIKPDMGAIYQVKISFRKAYSLYRCDEKNDSTKTDYVEPTNDEVTDIENDDNQYNNDYYNYGEDGDYSNYWENRDNPCHPAYYNSNRWVNRNLIASNIGLIGKLGSKNNLTIIATNITDAKPAGNVDIEAFDLQHQSLGKASTNGDGFATIDCPHKPALVIAKKGDEYGYLSMRDGQSLSLSMFDIKGQETQKGLKGFIYGERGVWRPGDSIYLTFIIENKLKEIPEGLPVVFELTNPKGQLFKRQVKVQNMNGFYTYFTSTPEDAPTGNWLITVKAGGAIFTKTIKIETIKPNRLAIELDLGKEKVLKGAIKGTITAKWLHGAIASNMKTNITMGLTKSVTTFSKFPDYNFDNAYTTFKPQEQAIFEGNLNNEGKSEFSYNISTDNSSSGMLKLALVTKVFEDGGNFSIDYFNTLYSPYNYYAGLSLSRAIGYYGWLYTDTTQRFNIATVDYLGNPVSRKNITVELVKLNWNWWWDRSDEDIANYISSANNSVFASKTISTMNGYGSVDFLVDGAHSGSYYLHVIDPDGQNSGRIVYFYNPWYRDYSDNQHAEAASMLIVSPNKDKYAPGEKARISFPAAKKSHVLVSIESGSSIIDMFWSDAIPNAESRATIEFEVTEKMAPNAFVNITLLQPYQNTGNDMPFRMYGYAPILVENPETHLHPVINMPEKVGSEEKLNIKVSEKDGRKMTYTLALVDEGLLNITRYKAPDPWESFYAKEALGINTWDIYNYIFGGVAGKIEHLFSIGGDMEVFADKGDKLHNRFTPVVKFLGPFTLPKNGTNQHIIQLPKYSGAVRVMVVAGENDAFGSAEKTAIVKNKLMIIATLPRVLGPGEEVQLPVSIFADEQEMKDVNLQVQTNELLSTIGEDKQTVKVNSSGSIDAFFHLKTADAIGVGKIKVTAASGKYKADYEIDLKIRNPNEKETRLNESGLEAGKSWNGKTEWFGVKGSNSASLEISSCPPIDLKRRLNYLLEYPYGCIEQTTSSVFPQLYLNNFIDLSNAEKLKAENNIKAGIERLKMFFTSEGAFSYWPGENYVNDWGCCYAGHFIIEAEKNGYSLPEGIKNGWLSYEEKQARNWPYNDSYLSYVTQAYRLMVLALAGHPEVGPMNRLKESAQISTQAKWLLALAYAYIGQKETAQSLINKLSWDYKSYHEFGYTFGSDFRDIAMVIPTLIYLKEYDKAFPLAEKLAKQLSSDEWYSTQETAFGLIAMSQFIGNSGLYKEGLNFSLSINGKVEKIQSSQKIFVQNIDGDNMPIQVNNTSKGTLYVRLITQGTPTVGNEAEVSSNLIMSIKYVDIKGHDIDYKNLKQGTDFKAVVTITNPPTILGNYQNLALAQIFPSGWEIINTRLADMDNTSTTASKPDYQDIRDDRVYSFFSMGTGQSTTFEISLNASYAGRFYLPAQHCDAMYDNNVKALKKGCWVEVVK